MLMLTLCCMQQTIIIQTQTQRHRQREKEREARAGEEGEVSRGLRSAALNMQRKAAHRRHKSRAGKATHLCINNERTHACTHTHTHAHSYTVVKSVSVIAKVMAKVQLWVQVNKNYSNMQNTIENATSGGGKLASVCVCLFVVCLCLCSTSA